MESVCNTCLLRSGCAFVILTPDVSKCARHIDVNLSHSDMTLKMKEYENAPAMTKDDIEVA